MKQHDQVKSKKHLGAERPLKSYCRSVDERVFYFMRDFNAWTFWGLQRKISEDFGTFYSEATISAAIRQLRKERARIKFDFPQLGEIVQRERIPNKKGYRYRLTHQIMRYWGEAK